MATEQAPEPVVLNWGKGSGAYALKTGSKTCITCGKPAFVINPDGQPQHKVCAERLLQEARDA